MLELFSLLSIGIALSMDTFSLSLSIGTLNLDNKKILTISSIIGIMHFLMPVMGLIIGKQILKILIFDPHILVSGILLFIAVMMIKDLNQEQEVNFGLTLFEIFMFSISVSFDSFMTGIGLKALTNNNLLASLIFAICSFTFTFLGLTIGKYSKEKLGKIATIFGIFLLVITAIIHIIR